MDCFIHGLALFKGQFRDFDKKRSIYIHENCLEWLGCQGVMEMVGKDIKVTVRHLYYRLLSM